MAGFRAGSRALPSPHPQLCAGLEAGSGREMGGAERLFFGEGKGP